VLVTGYDILFFWVARMMIFGLFAMDGVPPFHTIALHGLVRDKFGKKMSKSRGNTIDPLEFMDKYGADALRFSLARGANPGTDQALAEEWVAGSRNFATKLWNASRFALMNGATTSRPLPESQDLSQIDNWIISRLHQTITEADAYFEAFEFAKACDAIYHFAWDDFCDWYLELSKSAITQGGAQAENAQGVIGHVLDNLLRLLHPVMPFITEALWKRLTGGESLVIANWPAPLAERIDEQTNAATEEVKLLITEVRRFRNDQGVKPSAPIPGRFIGIEQSALAPFEQAIRGVLRITSPESSFTPSGSILVGSMRCEFDLSGTVDVVAERARLQKDLASVEKDRETARVKLDNGEFMAKAPEKVVATIKARLEECDRDIARITEQLSKLSG
jgi:valyl-tRNA synthetase